MPTYVYQGLSSGITFELEQRITESALTHHPETNEPVKRLIGRPAISFKGSGFYANDSKSNAGGPAKAAAAGDAKPSDSTAESSTPAASTDTSAPTAPAKEASSAASATAPAPAAAAKSAT